jgi:hypothetical protein
MFALNGYSPFSGGSILPKKRLALLVSAGLLGVRNTDTLLRNASAGLLDGSDDIERSLAIPLSSVPPTPEPPHLEPGPTPSPTPVGEGGQLDPRLASCLQAGYDVVSEGSLVVNLWNAATALATNLTPAGRIVQVAIAVLSFVGATFNAPYTGESVGHCAGGDKPTSPNVPIPPVVLPQWPPLGPLPVPVP